MFSRAGAKAVGEAQDAGGRAGEAAVYKRAGVTRCAERGYARIGPAER